jgi:murein DD-endopeptidase MepM/ murein hydrolase activator NlpD
MVRDLNVWLPNWSPPVTTPSTPEEPVFVSWREQFDTMFGAGKWRITQDWAAYGGPDLYEYGDGHGLDGSQHTGIDVGIPYGSKIFAPADATVVCGGTGKGPGANGQGCDAFNDWGDGDSVKQGVGRIELLFPDGRSLIYGHSRTATVKPGDKVTRGQQIGTSGGMYGAHIHLEARKFANGTYQLFNPKTLLESLPIGATQPEPEQPPMAINIMQALNWSGSNRPGTAMNNEPLLIGLHDTGNPGLGANATMHKNFVVGGGGSDRVSFHFTVDSTGTVWQMLRLDEIGYHAADGCDSRENDEGCFATVAIEMCVNSDGDPNKTYKHLQELVAAIIRGDPRINYGSRKPSDFSIDRIWTHQQMSAEAFGGTGKYCPTWILNRDLFPVDFKKGVAAYLGTTPGPVDPPPPPPAVELMPGVDIEVAQWLFGDELAPDYVLAKSGGVLSPLYKKRCIEEGIWPPLFKRKVWDVRVYYQFSNGWVALFNDKDKSIRWIDEEQAA